MISTHLGMLPNPMGAFRKLKQDSLPSLTPGGHNMPLTPPHLSHLPSSNVSQVIFKSTVTLYCYG